MNALKSKNENLLNIPLCHISKFDNVNINTRYKIEKNDILKGCFYCLVYLY